MELIKEALTFDDVLIEPKYSEILPAETNLSQKISKKITLNLPFLSAAMDTVTESKMAMRMADLGGLGIIHRNFKIEDQIREVKKVKKKNLLVGAAVGTSQENLSRAKKLLDSGVDIIVVDTAHGHSKKVLNIVEKIKRFSSQVPLCAGNIATGQAALRLHNAGSDILKVGIGPGSICTTRMVAGIGVPQVTAIMNVKKALGKRKVKIISDGGIKFSGDLVKALAAGADAIMMGSIFAGTEESPGQKFRIKNKFFKAYRGMGSRGAMSSGSSDRYFQKNFSDKSKFIPEGVESRVIYKGSVKKIMHQLQGGLRSSMGYIGAKKIKDIQKNAKFVKITKAGFYESMVHSVIITGSAENYKL